MQKRNIYFLITIKNMNFTVLFLEALKYKLSIGLTFSFIL